MSASEKKTFNKLKYDLENWREAILLINSLLKWDKNFYPGIIFTGLTIFYALLWYLDFSVLTLTSLGLLTITLVDYCYPILSRIIFKSDNWTGIQERKFEEVCNELCTMRMKLISIYNSAFAAKEEKSTIFVASMSVGLLILAWIGSTIDNLLLSYLTSLVITLYPGLQYHGFINTIKGKFGSAISSKLSELKQKAAKSD